tara:strand:- start:163 stop:336 length:174 start_codon:yes stop_codon:yes gene_type:complete
MTTIYRNKVVEFARLIMNFDGHKSYAELVHNGEVVSNTDKKLIDQSYIEACEDAGWE